MSTLKTRVGRGLAAGLATAMVAAGLGMMPSASAATATGSLQWGISQQFVNHLFYSKMGPVLPTTPTGSVSGGATHEAGDPTIGEDDLFSFPAAESSQAADGTVTSTFTGSVRGAFVVGVEQYSVTISDPILVVSPSGEGELRATVSGEVPGAEPDPIVTDPTEVTVAEFSGAVTTAGTTTVTPNWAGVLPAGSQAAIDLGISTEANPGRPVDGKSFHPEFLGALPAGVRAHFYWSTSGDHKAPGQVSATTQMVPSVTPTVTAASYANGVTVKVDGEGFTAVTNPGDAGVYVGLAPADTVIDFDDRDGGISAFAAVDWVMPSRFSGDAFTTVLNAPTDKLVKGTDYAIFTWQAHTHSNETQDTVTPFAIDWSKLAAPVKKIAPKIKRKMVKPKRKKAGKVTVTVTGKRGKATGRVVVKVKRGKKVLRKVNQKLNAKGKRTVRLPKGKKGAYRVIVQYRGNSEYKKARKVFKYKIR